MKIYQRKLIFLNIKELLLQDKQMTFSKNKRIMFKIKKIIFGKKNPSFSSEDECECTYTYTYSYSYNQPLVFRKTELEYETPLVSTKTKETKPE